MGSTELSQLLRGVLGIAGGLGFLLGLAVIVAGEPVGGSWLLILIALYEQSRYRAHPDEGAAGLTGSTAGPPWSVRPPAGPPPGPGTGRYERTDEVFEDPTTGRRLRVWFDPATGDRRYLPEP
jgi:hypothetical protein